MCEESLVCAHLHSSHVNTTAMCLQVTEKESREIMSKVLSLIEDEASIHFSSFCSVSLPSCSDASPQRSFHVHATGQCGQQGHLYRVRFLSW